MSTKSEANRVATLSVFFLVLLFTLSVSGSPSAESFSSEENAVLQRIRERHKNTHAIRATVFQDKDLSTLKDPVHVEGSVVFQKPGLLRWESSVPEKSVTIIDRDTIQVYYPDDWEAEIHKLSDNFIMRNTMTFFGSVMWGDMEEMEKRFTISMRREGGELLVRLQPHSKIVSRYLSSVIIRYNNTTGMPQGFEVMTPRGDRTVTTLKDLQINPEIDSDTFVLKLPPDVRVRDYTVTFDTN